jgi:hypothetical protein
MQHFIVSNPVQYEIEGKKLLLRKEVDFEGDTRWVMSNTKGEILAEEKYPVETNEVMLKRLYNQWRETTKANYGVKIERLIASNQWFEVEAHSEEEAKEKALRLACNAEGHTDNSEYNVLSVCRQKPE